MKGPEKEQFLDKISVIGPNYNNGAIMRAT